MWHATHLFPSLLAPWCECASGVTPGPGCRCGPWHCRHISLPGNFSSASCVRAVRIVARVAADPFLVHPALDEIISLHPVLVRGSVWPVRKGRLSEAMRFEIPGRTQPITGLITHGPVVVPALDRILARTALRVALDADIVRPHIVKAARVDDVGFHRARDVSAARAMATLAADIPFGDRMRLDIVVHRVAAVTQRARRTRLLLLRVILHPPVGARLT